MAMPWSPGQGKRSSLLPQARKLESLPFVSRQFRRTGITDLAYTLGQASYHEIMHIDRHLEEAPNFLLSGFH